MGPLRSEGWRRPRAGEEGAELDRPRLPRWEMTPILTFLSTVVPQLLSWLGLQFPHLLNGITTVPTLEDFELSSINKGKLPEDSGKDQISVLGNLLAATGGKDSRRAKRKQEVQLGCC